MARIEYNISLDSSGKVTIVKTIERIDLCDEIVFRTDTPNAALKWNTGSPFAPPAEGSVYMLPQANAASQTLQVTRSIDISEHVAQCGESDNKGNFTPWPSVDGGFSSNGGTNRH